MGITVPGPLRHNTGSFSSPDGRVESQGVRLVAEGKIRANSLKLTTKWGKRRKSRSWGRGDMFATGLSPPQQTEDVKPHAQEQHPKP